MVCYKFFKVKFVVYAKKKFTNIYNIYCRLTLVAVIL